MNRVALEYISKRSLAFLLAALVLLITITPHSVYAAPESQSAENIGTSLYDVSTALSAYVNGVVGSNTNDKHADHKITELRAAEAGDAGALVGYGDVKKGFYPYIASSNSKSVTTSSYEGWLNVGDDGKTYAYVRYGYLLNDLGLDETAIEGNNGYRSVAGKLLQFSGMASSAVPKLFEMCLNLLRTLNPFSFIAIDTDVYDFANDNALDQNRTQEEWDSMFEAMDDSLTGGSTTVSTAHEAHALDHHVIDPNSALYPLAKELSNAYNQLQEMGIAVVMPLLFAFVLWTLLMTKSQNKGRAVITWIQRIAFCAIGVPILAMLYTTALDEVYAVTAKAPAQVQMIGSTFVDFQGWVNHGRLGPTADLISNGAGQGDNKGNSASGLASFDTVRTLRKTVYDINLCTGMVSGTNPLSGVSADDVAFKTGAWDTNTAGKVEMHEDKYTDAAGNDITTDVVKQTLELLNKYQKGERYSPAAWETAVNGTFSSTGYKDKYGDQGVWDESRKEYDILGNTSSTADAGSNAGKIYGMWSSTDNSTDWLDRSAGDNEKIFTKMEYSNGGEWAKKPWNIFSNGSLNAVYTDISNGVKSDITYKAVSGWNKGTNGFDPNMVGGLSTVAMYNYLCSEFTDSSINVYSSVNSSSNYVKSSHYAVNLVGGSALRFGYGLNCFVVLCILSMLGLVYGIGMCYSNMKRGIKLITSIPMALVGVLRSVVQVIVFVIAMIMELIGTVFLYTIMGDLIITFATVIEQPLRQALNSVIIGGQLASVAGMNVPVGVLYQNNLLFALALIIVTACVALSGYGLYKVRRPVLVVYEYAWCKLYRRLTCAAMKPIFDTWMATRHSMYVWDFNMPSIKTSIKDVWAGLPDLPASGVNYVQKGVVMS